MNIQGIAPNVAAPQQAQSASAPRASTNGTSSPNTGSTGLLGGSSTDLQGTFLNLLATELQNQDPTNPVDPTEMVGQMVSLNQLDQLIAMNQTLTSMAAGTASAASSSSNSISSQIGAKVAPSLAGAGTEIPSGPGVAGTSTSTQERSLFAPVDPNAMMNLYGSTPVSNTSFTTTGGK